MCRPVRALSRMTVRDLWWSFVGPLVGPACFSRSRRDQGLTVCRDLLSHPPGREPVAVEEEVVRRRL